MPAKETKPAPPKKAAAKKPAATLKAVPPKKGTTTKGATKGATKGTTTKGKAPEADAKHRGSQFKALFVPKIRKPANVGDVRPKKQDLTRFVRWPRYVRIQRQRKVLYNRLKVPPALNQFSRTLDRNASIALFKLLNKYRPEEVKAKQKRLLEVAKSQVKGQATPDNLKKPLSVVHGSTQVTKAIEAKRAKLVVIAHDVDPVELVLALPTLCRKLDIPYVIVKGKAALGNVVRRKTTAAIAITDVDKADKSELAHLATIARDSFNDNVEHRRQWGGGKLGAKSAAKIAERQKAVAKEQAARDKAAASKGK
jgi:large subunit ribosomal protein L7Ae